MGGFFIIAPDDVAVATVPRCGTCGLYRKCKSPKMPVSGKGRRRVLVVAEAPGQAEDEQGTQLVGESGQRLRQSLGRLGWDLDRDCWKTNAVICRPKGEKPTGPQIKACRPNLFRTIGELEPNVIILLGDRAIGRQEKAAAVAVESLIGGIWKEGESSIGRWAGWRIPGHMPNAWICPTWHPSYLLRANDPVLDLWFDRHLEAALGLEGRPWPDGPPDYAAQVERVYEPGEAARLLRGMAKRGGTVAFDLETNKLKPDSEDAAIVSCAVCWEGKKTIAYPWTGEAVRATSELLQSAVGKIGWNIKFEERWIWRVLGHRVRNWVWDGMLAAHMLDHRQAVTSLKFQAFVQLGVPPYETAIAPFLQADHPNDANRIREVPLDQLLLYNGMDSFMTWSVCQKQRVGRGLDND